MAPRTLYDKIWDDHVVETKPDGNSLLYIDRHLVHEVTSPQAFEGLRVAGRKVRSPERGPQGPLAGAHPGRRRPQRADLRPFQGHRRHGKRDSDRDPGANPPRL